MHLKLSIAVLAVALSTPVFAAVSIQVPEEIVVLAVNGQEVNAGLFRSKSNEYKIDAGEANFSVRYQEYFEHLNGEHDVLKSGVVSIQTPALQDGQQYQLALVNAPQNFETAKKFVEQPTIALYDRNKKLVVQQTGANNEPRAWLGQGLLKKAVDLTQGHQNLTQQPAPVYQNQNTTTVHHAVTSTNSVASNTVASNSTGLEQQLIQTWQKASKAERQKFMSWLAEQAN